MAPDGVLSRIRWGNVARLAALVALAVVVAVWPRLRGGPPRLPPASAVPLGGASAGAEREAAAEPHAVAKRRARAKAAAERAVRAKRRERAERASAAKRRAEAKRQAAATRRGEGERQGGAERTQPAGKQGRVVGQAKPERPVGATPERPARAKPERPRGARPERQREQGAHDSSDTAADEFGLP
jgi:hypothetical protein